MHKVFYLNTLSINLYGDVMAPTDQLLHQAQWPFLQHTCESEVEQGYMSWVRIKPYACTCCNLVSHARLLHNFKQRNSLVMRQVSVARMHKTIVQLYSSINVAMATGNG